MPSYQTVGDLVLTLRARPRSPRDYRRDLDLDTALSRASRSSATA